VLRFVHFALVARTMEIEVPDWDEADTQPAPLKPTTWAFVDKQHPAAQPQHPLGAKTMSRAKKQRLRRKERERAAREAAAAGLPSTPTDQQQATQPSGKVKKSKQQKAGPTSDAEALHAPPAQPGKHKDKASKKKDRTVSSPEVPSAAIEAGDKKVEKVKSKKSKKSKEESSDRPEATKRRAHQEDETTEEHEPTHALSSGDTSKRKSHAKRPKLAEETVPVPANLKISRNISDESESIRTGKLLGAIKIGSASKAQAQARTPEEPASKKVSATERLQGAKFRMLNEQVRGLASHSCTLMM
jgi:hypothetical protein